MLFFVMSVTTVLCNECNNFVMSVTTVLFQLYTEKVVRDSIFFCDFTPLCVHNMTSQLI